MSTKLIVISFIVFNVVKYVFLNKNMDEMSINVHFLLVFLFPVNKIVLIFIIYSVYCFLSIAITVFVFIHFQHVSVSITHFIVAFLQQ